jgi:hypothetical protein
MADSYHLFLGDIMAGEWYRAVGEKNNPIEVRVGDKIHRRNADGTYTSLLVIELDKDNYIRKIKEALKNENITQKETNI